MYMCIYIYIYMYKVLSMTANAALRAVTDIQFITQVTKACLHIYICIYQLTCTYVYLSIYMHIYIHIYIRIYIYIHVCIHIYI